MPNSSLAAAHIDTTTKPAIIFRFRVLQICSSIEQKLQIRYTTKKLYTQWHLSGLLHAMTRDMVQPRKSGTFFQIRRISSKKSCCWVKTFSRIFASQVVTRCKQPCLVWQGGSEESCKCGGSTVCQGSQISPISCFQKHFQFWHFQVAKTGVWSHRFEYSEKIIILAQTWKSWETPWNPWENYYWFGSAMEKQKPGILNVPSTSKPAHSSEILYDKCFFEYITTTFVTFWC